MSVDSTENQYVLTRATGENSHQSYQPDTATSPSSILSPITSSKYAVSLSAVLADSFISYAKKLKTT